MRKLIFIIALLISFFLFDNVKAQTITTDFGNVEVNSYFAYYNSSGGGPYYQTLSNYIVANNSSNSGVVLINNPSLSFTSFNSSSITLGVQTTQFYYYNFSTQRWIVQTNSSFANKVYYSTLDYINSYNYSTKVLTLHKLENNKFTTDSITLNTYSTFNNKYNGIVRYNYAYTYDSHIFITNSTGNSNVYIQNAYKNCDYFLALNYNVSQNYSSEARYCSSQPYSIVNGYLYTPNNTSTGINLGNNASTYNGYYLSTYNLSFSNGSLNSNFEIAQNIVPEFSFSTNNNYDSLGTLTSVDIRLNVSNYNSNLIYQFQKNGTSGTWTTMQLEFDSSSNEYFFTWLFTENSFLYVRAINSSGSVISSATLEISNIDIYENVSSVIDLGSNHYGYFSNYVLVQNVKSTTENNLVSILCERDRPFENGFCSLYYNDLISNHSNIDYFNDTTFVFHTLFGDANNILVSNKYYVFNFRVLKPFVPDISNVVLSTNYGDIDLVDNFDKVYYNDGGSYTDYAIVFNTNNITLDSSYNLNSISVYFSVPLSNYYYNNIPDSFSFSIYRSFKLSYYDNIPDSNEISNLFSINNLSTIDGVNSQHLFFTDTTFNTYGFGGIISSPFRLLYALEDYDTCSDITIPFPHSNQNLTLKCVRSSIPSGINPLISILQIVLSGLICYRIAVSTLALIKQVLNPNDTNIEVVDL